MTKHRTKQTSHKAATRDAQPNVDHRQRVSSSMKAKFTDIKQIEPVTANQELAVDAWDDGDHLILAGTAGTGKTFLALGLALEDMLDPDTEFEQVVVIRSIVATRDPGHLPGTKQEKEDVFSGPYRAVIKELFADAGAYGKLIASKQLEFESTSFIRGVTWNNAIIVVDEMQNLNFHELDTVITRVGKNCRIIFCGDYKQTDFTYKDDKSGIFQFMNIIEHMNNFSIVTFDWSDVVRSGLVRDYIMTKEMLGVD
jgi:predicted ribonuclease YlaK